MPSYNEEDFRSPDGIVISIEGEEKCGKTWRLLETAPHPLVYINCDRVNARAIKNARRKGRRILYSKDYLYVPSANLLHKAGQKGDDPLLAENARVAGALWNPMMQDWRDALKDSRVKTVVLDSGTSAYAIVRAKSYGKLSGVAQISYAKTNAIWLGDILKSAENSGKAVFIIHRLGPEFAKPKDSDGPAQPTGRLIAQGFRETNFEVGAVIRCSITHEGKYKAKLTAEGVGRADLRGKFWLDEQIDYTQIVAKLTGTKVEKWQ